MTEKMKIEIIDENSFLYNGHLIQTNKIIFWINSRGNGRNIHLIGHSGQTIISCLSAYVKKTFSEKLIFNNIELCLNALIKNGFKI